MARGNSLLTEAKPVINYDESTPLVVDLTEPRHVAPPDKYWLAYWIFFFFGVVSLLPWYVFPNIEQYYRSQLFDYPYVAKHVVNYMALATQVPSALVLFINTYIIKLFSEPRRILISLSTVLAVFMISMVLAILNMDNYQTVFLVMTVSSILIINTASCIFQGGVLAIAGRFPVAYRQSIMSGQGLGGLIAASSNLLTLLAAGGPRHLTRQQLARGAVWYFLSAQLVTVVCIVGYCLMHRLAFVQFYPQRAGMRRPHNGRYFTTMRNVLKKMWHMALSTFLVFLVSLMIFPGLGAQVRSVMELPHTCDNSTNSSDELMNESSNTTALDPRLEAWVCTYFQPVVCFLLFNLWSFLGRTAPAKLRVPGPRYLLVPCVLRFVLLGLYGLMKYSVYHKPYFNSDIAPIVAMTVVGFTNGYCNALAFMYAPALVDEDDVETAGAVMAASEGISSLAGVSIGLLLTDLYVDDIQKHLPSI